MKNLLVIAGFEANGFAGVIRDLQVVHSMGLHCSAIATTLTAQTENQLLTAKPVDTSLVNQQLATLTAPIHVVKIGLLPNVAMAQTIANWLKEQSPTPQVILDPVYTSSSNGEAFSNDSLIDIVQPILPYTTLITPNLNELSFLVKSAEHLSELALAQQFFRQNPSFLGNMLLTGGHTGNLNSSLVSDTLYQPITNQAIALHHWEQPRVNTKLRGTGCFISTSIACALVTNDTLTDAITLANAKLHDTFVQKRKSKENQTINSGWPTDISVFPTIRQAQVEPPEQNFVFPKLELSKGLYPIVDSSSWVKRLAKVGIKTIQLRIKSNDERKLRSEIKAAIAIEKLYELQLFINDHWQLAIEYNAYGVHLGQEDIEHADVSKIHSAGLRLGISTHGDTEFKLAHQYTPSYLAVGAIYPTKTKDMTGQIQGLNRLKRYCELSGSFPVVAIGGINESNLAEVMKTEPDFVAVVTAITEAKDPEAATRRLLKAMNAPQSSAALS